MTRRRNGAVLSPDGQWIDFFAGGKLKKVAVAGGAPIAMADAPTDSSGIWVTDGTIICLL